MISRPATILLIGLMSYAVLSTPSAVAMGFGQAPPLPEVDCDFPGGNILVDAIDGDTIRLHQDLRDTRGDWFYWYFRVRGAAGRTLTFQFPRENVIGVRGPAVSLDQGNSWTWLGTAAVNDTSFRYTFSPDADEVRFSFAMPYVESDLRNFLKAYDGQPNLKMGTLCETRKGRKIELLHLGRLDGRCEHRVLVTCRHHACEMMASYAIEGMIDAVLADTEDGKWLREHVEFLIIPFVDKDGVEDGDQGKNRKPYDHNRDYKGESIYPSVAAIRSFVPAWSRGRLSLAIDLHCPGIRGSHNEVIYMVGKADPAMWQRQVAFGKVLEEVQCGLLKYRAADNLPFGKSWNTGKNYGGRMSFSSWAAGLEGIGLATSFEIPYANAAGCPVDADSARAFGHDLARAVRQYLVR